MSDLVIFSPTVSSVIWASIWTRSSQWTHCQNFCCLLLSHLSPASGPSSGRPGSHTAAGHGIRHVKTRLL